MEIEITDSFKDVLHRLRRGDSLFLTGKAGTGKSTLLALAREEAISRGQIVATTASTGVAALNVGGETIHRFFGFRANLGPTLREYRVPDRLRDLEFLIIDEVSMVRADLLDMVDTALKRARKSRASFGGVQTLLVGDLYQLPPVVTGREDIHEMFQYPTPFFFSSRVMRTADMQTVELPDVFRQNDPDFIEVLNAIREGQVSQHHLDVLNQRVVVDHQSEDYSDFITLTGSNRKAEEINRRRLQELGDTIFVSRAMREGEIDETQFKAEENLEFAVGSRVMMLVNTDDFVNGSLGVVEDVVEDINGELVVTVALDDPGDQVKVKRYRWEISRAVRRGNQIVYEEIGVFEQLPFRLAWAVTIHKSQGKTFNKVIFDRDRGMFADGQMYVALSRCTSLDGLVLSREVTSKDVRVSTEVRNFFAKSSAKTSVFSPSNSVFVATVDTGGGEFNRLVELAISWQSHSGEEIMVSTLLNPNRDIADARRTGLEASDLSLAPDIEVIQPLVSRILAGKLIVSFGVTRFLNQMGWKEHADSVVGLEVSHPNHLSAENAEPTAVQALSRLKTHFEDLEGHEAPAQPFPHLDLPIPDGLYLLSRWSDATPDFALLCADLNLSNNDKKRLKAAFVREDSKVGSETSRDCTTEALAVLRALVEASSRDGRLSAVERQEIEDYASRFGLETPDFPSSDGVATLRVSPGDRVCLTGTAPSNQLSSDRSKASLRIILDKIGLIEVDSVTKKNCDLVVAYNESSMSGKAKKAREYGIPVIGSEQFLSMALELLGE